MAGDETYDPMRDAERRPHLRVARVVGLAAETGRPTFYVRRRGRAVVMVDRDATTAERRAGVAEELVYDDLASGDGPPLLRSKVDAYVRRTVGNRFVPESRRREWERRAAAGEQLTLFSLAAELDVTERVVADGLRDRP